MKENSKIYSYLNIFIHLISFIYGKFQGNDHLIYNRSFFYLHKETERIVRHPLINGLPKATRIKRNRVVQNSGKSLSWTITIFYPIYKIKQRNYLHIRNIIFIVGGPLLSKRLYAPQQNSSFLDFSADENGLWTIMGKNIHYHFPLVFWSTFNLLNRRIT